MKNYSTDIANKQELDAVKSVLYQHKKRLDQLLFVVAGSCIVSVAALVLSLIR